MKILLECMFFISETVDDGNAAIVNDSYAKLQRALENYNNEQGFDILDVDAATCSADVRALGDDEGYQVDVTMYVPVLFDDVSGEEYIDLVDDLDVYLRQHRHLRHAQILVSQSL